MKFGGNLANSVIKGAVAHNEILHGSKFLKADPLNGFSVRNFQIQTAKLAPVSDIVVYGAEGAKPDQLLTLAKQISSAQERWRQRFDPGEEFRLVNTFVLSS